MQAKDLFRDRADALLDDPAEEGGEKLDAL